MGLDAFVRCRCWEEALTSPPPLPADQIALDEEGFLHPTIPYDGNEQLHHAFYRWREDACAHDRMEAAWERIGSWHSYSLMLTALAHAGWQRFPTLEAELPSTNGGSMPAEAAARVLEELRSFTELADLGERTELLDTETGDVVRTYVPGSPVFMWLGPQARIGLDPAGFFIWDDTVDPPVEVFRAMAFTQRYAGGTGRDLRAEFSDAERRVVMRIGYHLIGGEGSTGPEHLEVVTRPAQSADFSPTVEALAAVCRAAVATGNPVIWC